MPSVALWFLTAAVAVAQTYDSGYGSTWDDENWTLTTTELIQGDFHRRMSLSNGYLGINLASSGPFFEVDTAEDLINEWPLFDRRQSFATISGFWDSQPLTEGSNYPWLSQYGGESVISGVPHFGAVYVQVGDDLLFSNVSSDQISDFSSTMDIKRGVLSWNYTWTPSSGSGIQIEYTMFVHKLYVNRAAVELRMTAQDDTNVTVIDVLQGDAAVRTTTTGTLLHPLYPVICSAVNPNGIDNVTAYIYSTLVGDDSCDIYSRQQVTDPAIVGGNSSGIGQSYDIALSGGQTSIIHKYIGGASSDAFDNPQDRAWGASVGGADSGWDAMLESHVAEWATILTPDSVDSYRFPDNNSVPNDGNIQELQITAITNSYYILQHTVGANAITAADNNTKLDINSIPVCGLGDSCYAGEIFWDSDVWMAPGLVVTNPQAMQQIAKYRVEKSGQAHANIETAYQSSQNDTYFSPDGAIFPWISSRFGNCTAVGPCWDYEYHVNGDIGLQFYNYYAASGDVEYFRDQLFPIYEAIAIMYSEVVKYNETAQQYYLYNATDPDEFANHATNAAYTMTLIALHLNNTNNFRQQFGMDVNETWATIAQQIAIPVDENAGIIKEYQDMNGTVDVKQADVVLIDDFLHYPNPYSLNDLDYYAAKQSLNGPAMTYGVFSIVANLFSQSGCASFTYDLYGSKPYLRAPWLQYSEQLVDDPAITGFHPAFPFLTGMGGALRVSVYGYLGLHTLLDQLHIDPSLPPQIPQIRYRTIYWQGWPVVAYSNQTHTTLTRNGTALATANQNYSDSAIPVTVGTDNTAYSLDPDGSVTVENRQIGNVNTVQGNIAQCRPVNYTGEYSPGQFPLSAVDGASSTKWQPLYLNQSASLIVELPGPFAPITEVRFDWAQAVPDSYSVQFANETGDASQYVNVTSSDNVQVSDEYDPSNLAEIVLPTSNTTNITLDSPVYSGRYAILTIEGNQALRGTSDENNGTGASVAEFILISA